MKRHKHVSLIVISVSSLFLLICFQNCNKVQYSDIPNANSSLGINDDSQPAGNDGSEQQTGTAPPPPENPFQPGIPDLALLPIEGAWASIAYEDNILATDAGDRDYNDAVFNYKISEQYNSLNQLVRIFLEIRLRERISASDHKLHLVLDGNASTHFDNISSMSLAAFNGEANATITYADGSSVLIESARSKKLTVFTGTSDAIGKVTKVAIEILNPELNVNAAANKVVNFKMYRFILQNKSQSRVGIDIAEINPNDEMLSNGNGYPFGFMIPTDWAPPDEKQLIDNKYPSFYKYRNWLNAPIFPIPEDVLSWYL